MSLFDLFQLRLFAEADIHFLPALPPVLWKKSPHIAFPGIHYRGPLYEKKICQVRGAV